MIIKYTINAGSLTAYAYNGQELDSYVAEAIQRGIPVEEIKITLEEKKIWTEAISTEKT